MVCCVMHSVSQSVSQSFSQSVRYNYQLHFSVPYSSALSQISRLPYSIALSQISRLPYSSALSQISRLPSDPNLTSVQSPSHKLTAALCLLYRTFCSNCSSYSLLQHIPNSVPLKSHNPLTANRDT